MTLLLTDAEGGCMPVSYTHLDVYKRQRMLNFFYVSDNFVVSVEVLILWE